MKVLAAAATLLALSVAPSATLAASSSGEANEAGDANVASGRKLAKSAKSGTTKNPKSGTTKNPKSGKSVKSGEGVCSSAVAKIEGIVGEFKKGNSLRYLQAFHEDAEVYMMAGHLEDGHQIKGRDHLHRCLATMTGTPHPDEEHRQLAQPWSFLSFVDSDYAGVELDAGACAVYLSLNMEFDPDDGTSLTYVSDGLVRYDVDSSNVVTAKLSLNNYCAPDTNTDANPEPGNQNRRLQSVQSCSDALQKVKTHVESEISSSASKATADAFATVKKDKDSCFVYYQYEGHGKKHIVRYTVTLGSGDFTAKLNLNNVDSAGTDSCVGDDDVNAVP